MRNRTLLYVINVDWYFNLHWLDRAKYFQSKGFKIHIISHFKDDRLKDELESNGFHCSNLFLKRKSLSILSELKYIFLLYKIIKSIKPNLIHCVTIKPNIYCGLLNRFFFKKPIVYSITGTGAIYSNKRYFILEKFISTLYRTISLNKTKFIFENSEDYILFTKKGIIHNNGVVIKGAGIDLKKFPASPVPYNGKILFAARLLREKGLEDLVEARNILNSRNVNITITVAGIIDNDTRSSMPLSIIEKWDKEGQINWVGNQCNMPELIKQHDLVCLPTTYGEGVPRILIEAASCQRAIVTTDVPGCREIVSEGFNGFLAQPGNAISLACCIQRVVSSRKKLLHFGLNGRAKVETEYAQEIVFEQTMKQYCNLLNDIS
ncbi:glycosyltransferase family 4 protein [Vibrio gazogenes]|uniref:Glycosyltransferase involved in cell wall bisynthesis n=2 Tax=Vibrio gazogenes TaxID=687 RepID=A0A1M5BEC3_VIBGA|nr:glycosyltransferase family 4 protein [Vibrio gazogenes]USP14018.1 glycosyltransferase family 4 protein [Vibrio gazogenes]SHF40755.1 Glycosyltransferase involved in cell wall bisynthesis [Vibrio gazogenes DSM 21264] [Vibrio gazogenes DSM 21264 = NBRC 103151]